MSEPACRCRVVSTSFHGFLERTELSLHHETNDVSTYLAQCRETLERMIKERLHIIKGLKLWMCASVTYHRTEDISEKVTRYFPSFTEIALNERDIETALDNASVKITHEVEQYEEKGSGWVISTVNCLDLYTIGYVPLKPSGYKLLPKPIELKKAIINVKNSDQHCFMWAILASLNPVDKNAERPSNYLQYIQTLNFDGISFPVKLSDISKFSTLNRISVNVFTCTENHRVYPVYRCEQRLERHVNLFLWNEHYSCIRHFDRLMGNQNERKSKNFYCDNCLFPMYAENRLIAHREMCRNSSLAALEMPDEENCTLKFRNIHRRLRAPIVVYADFEAILEPISSCEPESKRSSTTKCQHHMPCSVGMVVCRSCCSKPKFDNLFILTDKDPATKFLEKLIELTNEHAATACKHPLSLTESDERQFYATETCYICETELHLDRVRDHCHVCGKFRGALHSACNQLLRLKKELVVVFHNLKRYDGHLIMQAIGQVCQQRGLKLSCIAKNMENYVTFSIEHVRNNEKWKIRFIDSAQFLAASLEQLTSQLEKDQFSATMQFFGQKHHSLLTRKGVFPYDFLDSWEKLAFLNPITPDKFHNKLNNTNISAADYQHYLNVCSNMQIQTMQEYLELYLKVDVLILADVFEEFREFTLTNFGLDPCHYATLPGLSWDSCLKMTKIELELMTDIEMYTFLEDGIRGGISVICQREATASNLYTRTRHSADQPENFIIYYDANNLYGWAMLQHLPIGGFHWLTEAEIKNLDLSHIDPEGDTGYVLEVDLEYPKHLHDKHNCYPLAPEKITITEEMLSPYYKEIAGKHNAKVKPVRKLAPNLRDKQHYTVHYRNLQFYLEQGLILKKVHGVLGFKQKKWIEPYISFNTNMRKAAKTQFQKNLYKFNVNAFFGKTMENVRKYVNVELVTNLQRLRKLTKKSQFERAVVFSEELVGCSIGRTVIHLNKPIYIGFIVLELSKLLMYCFHYNYILEKYGSGAKLLMTDTDSLMYQITTESDIYLDMRSNAELFDTSDYPDGHFLKSDENKKVVGKMKDELNGQAAEQFIGLRSKMYSLKVGAVEKKRAKGVKRKTVEDDISHADFASVLREQTFMHHKMQILRSEKHQIYSVSLNKKSLSCFDDKRYVLDDGVHTLAYGHYMTQ